MNKEKLVVGHCDNCNTEAVLTIQAIVRTDQQVRDEFGVHCLRCNTYKMYNNTIPSTFIDIFNIDRNVSINQILTDTSIAYSSSYIKTDLFYLLNMFYVHNNQNVQVYVNPKDAFSWSFNFRMPKQDGKDVFIAIRNVNSDTVYITTNDLASDEKEIRDSIDALFAYIITFCDERTNGYITNLITIRLLGEDMERRVKEIKDHFYQVYGSRYKGTSGISNYLKNLSPQIQQAVQTRSTISSLLPKTTTQTGGYTAVPKSGP